jgi:hypothetical protein
MFPIRLPTCHKTHHIIPMHNTLEATLTSIWSSQDILRDKREMVKATQMPFQHYQPKRRSDIPHITATAYQLNDAVTVPEKSFV